MRKNFLISECSIFLVDVTKYGLEAAQLEESKKILENAERRKFSCYICSKKFRSKELLNQHQIVHKDAKYKESEQEESLVFNPPDEEVFIIDSTKQSESETLNKPNDFLLTNNNELDYKCIGCDVYFKLQSEVRSHLHIPFHCKYFCKRCERLYNTKGGFIVHILQHDMNKTVKLTYACNKCQCFFDDCYQLKRHYNSAHNICAENSSQILSTAPIFDCDVCYDVFTSAKALIQHKILHKNKKKHDNEESIIINDDDVPQTAVKKKFRSQNRNVANRAGTSTLKATNQLQQKSLPSTTTSSSCSTTSNFLQPPIIGPPNLLMINPKQEDPVAEPSSASTNCSNVLLNPLMSASLNNLSTFDPTNSVYVLIPATAPAINNGVLLRSNNSSNLALPVIPTSSAVDNNGKNAETKILLDSVPRYDGEYSKLVHNVPTKLVEADSHEQIPKISVKKLSDLMDNNNLQPSGSKSTNIKKINGKNGSKIITNNYFHCQYCNNRVFINWITFRSHMEKAHGKFGCKYLNCCILDDAIKEQQHINDTHLCKYCKEEFPFLYTHIKMCSSRKNSTKST